MWTAWLPKTKINTGRIIVTAVALLSYLEDNHLGRSISYFWGTAIKLRFIMNFRKIGKDRKAEGGKLFIFSLLISGVKVGSTPSNLMYFLPVCVCVSVFFFFPVHTFYALLLQTVAGHLMLCFFHLLLNRNIYICF